MHLSPRRSTTASRLAVGLALLAAGFVVGRGAAPRQAQAATAPTTYTVHSSAARVQAATFFITATATPTTATVNQPITFAASVDGNPPNDLTFTWTFGDGTPAQSGSTVTHAYTKAGSFSATVAAVSAANTANAAAAELAVTITNAGGSSPALSVTVSASPNPVTVGQPTTISYAVTGSGAAQLGSHSLTIDYGDGVSPDPLTPPSGTITHTYGTAGTFTATVTAVISSDQPSAAAGTQIVVTAATNAPNFGTTIGATTVTPQVNQPIELTTQSPDPGSPTDLQYSWDFGDGTPTASGAITSHAYTKPGTYTITVTIASASNPADAQKGTLTITVSPAAQTTPSGPTVTYPAGWNMIAGPVGTVFSQASGPLYTIQPGTNQYQTQPNTQPVAAGAGYWAFFTQPTTVTLTGTSGDRATVQDAANTYIFIGNPSATQTLTVHGADACFSYDPTSNAFSIVTTLKPGQACAALSTSDTTVSVGG